MTEQQGPTWPQPAGQPPPGPPPQQPTRRGGVPGWVKAAGVGVIAFLAGVGIGGAGGDDTTTAAAPRATETVTERVTETVTERVTEEAEESEDVAAEEPAPAPQPAAVEDPIAVRDRLGGLIADDPAIRDEFIRNLEAPFAGQFDTIDRVTYDPATGVVTVYGTTLLGDNQFYDFAEDAWSYVRIIGQDYLGQLLPDLDYEGDLAAATPGFAFEMDGGGHTASCPGVFMFQLSRREVDRANFDQVCQPS